MQHDEETGVCRDDIVCGTTCEIYVPSSLPAWLDDVSLQQRNWELYSFGRCDVYLIQYPNGSTRVTGYIPSYTGGRKLKLDLDLNSITDDKLHCTKKTEHWYEFWRHYGDKDYNVTINICQEDSSSDKFSENLDLCMQTLQECGKKNILPDNIYRIVAFQTAPISNSIPHTSDDDTSQVDETSTYEESGTSTQHTSVKDQQDHLQHKNTSTGENDRQREHMVFVHIVPRESKTTQTVTGNNLNIKLEESSNTDLENSDRSVTSMPDQLSERLLTCTVCSQKYDLSDRYQPHLLPCLHACCKHCLQTSISMEKLQCPSCEVSFTVTPSDIQQVYPLDIVRCDLLNFVAIKNRSGDLQCDVCSSSVAITRCSECSEWLCGECKDAHQRVTATKAHTLLTIDHLQQSTTLDSFNRPVMCSEHTNTPVQYYCYAESCQKYVCVTCILQTCKEKDGHKTVLIDDLIKAKRESIRHIIGQNRAMKNNIENAIEQTKSELVNIESQRKHVEIEIDDTFNKLLERIEERRTELKNQNQQCADVKTKCLQRQTDDLQHLLTKFSDSQEYASLTLCSSSATFLQVEDTVGKCLKELSSYVYDTHPMELATFGFRKQDLNPSIEKSLFDCSRIWTCSVSPTKTEITLDETIFDERRTAFILEMKTSDGMASSCEPSVVYAVVKTPEGQDIECDIKMKSVGTFEISADLVDFGQHNLLIYMGEKIVTSQLFERTRVILRPKLPKKIRLATISLSEDTEA